MMSSGANHDERGFTLIETLIVMVVLGIASVVITNISGNLFVGQAANRDLVVGTQLMQECAEMLLAKGRANYGDSCLASNAAATSCCNAISVGSYSAPTVTVTPGNSGTANMTACNYSSGSNCTLISITQGGQTPFVLMLEKH